MHHITVCGHHATVGIDITVCGHHATVGTTHPLNMHVGPQCGLAIALCAHCFLAGSREERWGMDLLQGLTLTLTLTLTLSVGEWISSKP